MGGAGHRLAPLLEPHSIAVIGASGRQHRPGNLIMESIKLSGFSGPVYPVNPGYSDIMGWRCFAALDDVRQGSRFTLPGTPVVAAVGARGIVGKCHRALIIEAWK